MFFFKKLITPFVLPPGIFILTIIISGALFIILRRRKMGIFNLAIGFLLWIFCSIPFSNLLMNGLESDFHIPQKVDGDVIILLCGGIIEDIPDFSGYGSPTDHTLGRIVTAVRLQKKLNIPIIVSGGMVYKSKSSEALIAKRFLTDLGVDEDQVIIEEKSRDTYENAKFSAEICKRKVYKKPILVTSAFHMKRSLLSFKKFDMNVLPYPSNFKSNNIYDFSWHSYLPLSSSLQLTSDAFHEYLGILFYRLAH